ncbi:MAG: anthranilate phosphoribosyltransferase, partial [Anaerolineales bacterium]|nr:anthranilate phosphoribosyltransferase [Anaerolineales bacterium]
AGATHQLVGVFSPDLVETLARVLGELGVTGAMVVHGADGLDELSTTGVNTVSHLHNGEVRSYKLDPLDLGIPRANLDDLIGGEAEENAVITRAILSGKEQGPRRDIVLLNAAALLSIECGDWQAGLAEARAAIDSGRALAVLDNWVEKTNSF